MARLIRVAKMANNKAKKRKAAAADSATVVADAAPAAGGAHLAAHIKFFDKMVELIPAKYAASAAACAATVGLQTIKKGGRGAGRGAESSALRSVSFCFGGGGVSTAAC